MLSETVNKPKTSMDFYLKKRPMLSNESIVDSPPIKKMQIAQLGSPIKTVSIPVLNDPNFFTDSNLPTRDCSLASSRKESIYRKKSSFAMTPTETPKKVDCNMNFCFNNCINQKINKNDYSSNEVLFSLSSWSKSLKQHPLLSTKKTVEYLDDLDLFGE